MSFGKGGGSAARGASAAEIAANQAAIDETRRQFDLTKESLDPFVQAGARQLPALESGATVGGLDEILGQIFGSESFANLRDERTRALEGQLASGGFTRSGTALQDIANVPTDLGFAIEQLLTGRKQSLAGQAQTGATNLGQIGASASSDIASLLSGQGRSQASGILGAQQAKAQGSQNLLNTAATIGSIFFSDINLKENIEQIGVVNTKDNKGDDVSIPLIQWDWLPSTKGTMIENCGTIGFPAQAVNEIFPEYVHEFGGFKMIDYPSLLNRLGNNNA